MICPNCGKNVEGTGIVQCECGQYLSLDENVTKEELNRITLKRLCKVLICYNLFILGLIALFIVLIVNIDSNIPYLTVLPLTIFFMFCEIIFVHKFIQFWRKNK